MMNGRMNIRVQQSRGVSDLDGGILHLKTGLRHRMR